MTDRQETDEPEDAGFSLEEMTRAFAETLGEEADDEPASGEASEEASAEERLERAIDAVDADDPCELCPRTILEAMLFADHPDHEPLTAEQAAGLMRGVSPEEIEALVCELNAVYDADAAPYRIASVGPGYRLLLRDDYQWLRDRFYGKIKEARLSQAAIDVLALVAYRQPIGRETLDELRGKPSGSLLNQLVRRRLVRVERDEGTARHARYHTTSRFLKLFGIRDLEELPRPEDVERL